MENSIIIALTGRRQVGKSHIASHLVKNHDFIRLHPFNPGKAGCRAMFKAMGARDEQLHRLTDDDLKDVPMGFLPCLKEHGAHPDTANLAREFCRGVLEYLDIEPAVAYDMVRGYLIDSHHDFIPGGATPRQMIKAVEEYMLSRLWAKAKGPTIRSPKTKFLVNHPEATPGHHTSRHVMERLGQFMGVDMGQEWTIGAEVDHARRNSDDTRGRVIESIVYEAANLRELSDAYIVRVTADREKPIESPESDAFVQSIVEDAKFHNDMTGIAELGPAFDTSMAGQGIIYGQATTSLEPEPCF